MVQEILTYLILLTTLVVVFRKLYRLHSSLNKPKPNQRKLEKCDSCNSGCSLKGINTNTECLSEQTDQQN